MAAVVPESIDLATLSALAGDLGSNYLLERIRAQGHPHLRTSHGYVFQHLIDATPTVTELARGLGISQQAVSKAIVELERLGYVARGADRADSRIRRVSLTMAGREVVEVARHERGALEHRLRSLVGDVGLAHAKRTIAVLIDAVGGTGAVRGRRVRPPS